LLKKNFLNAAGFMSGNILVFSITDLLGNFARALVFPYASLYILSLGGNVTNIGIINSLAPLAWLVILPIAGYLSDHAGRVRVIVWSSLYSVIVVLIYVLAPTWEVIVVATLLSGFGVFQFPARSALIADSLSPENRGKGISWMNTISSTLVIIAPFIAGIVIEQFGANLGVRTLYGAMVLLYLCSTIIQIGFLKEKSIQHTFRLKIRDMTGLLKNAYTGLPGTISRFPRSLKALTVVIILSFMCNGVASPFYVVFAINEIGFSPLEWGMILLVESVVKLIFFIPAGWLVDRWGRTNSLLGALVLSLVSIPLFVFVTNFSTVLLIRIIVAVSFTIAIPACTALMADIIPRENRGRVMALVGQGGIMIGPAGGGTGGPAVGLLITIPIMISSLMGGYLYALAPRYPWYFVLAATLCMVVITVLFVRDPQNAEI
jgi:MFS family permease